MTRDFRLEASQSVHQRNLSMVKEIGALDQNGSHSKLGDEKITAAITQSLSCESGMPLFSDDENHVLKSRDSAEVSCSLLLR